MAYLWVLSRHPAQMLACPLWLMVLPAVLDKQVERNKVQTF
jgi:hypothetical protein